MVCFYRPPSDHVPEEDDEEEDDDEESPGIGVSGARYGCLAPPGRLRGTSMAGRFHITSTTWVVALRKKESDTRGTQIPTPQEEPKLTTHRNKEKAYALSLES